MAETNQGNCAGTCAERARQAFEHASMSAKPTGKDMADLTKRFVLLREMDERADKHKEAEITLEHALALYEAAYGQEHHSVGQIMLALAEVYNAHGNSESAEYMQSWADDILSRPKEEPVHEFFHLFKMDVPDEQSQSEHFSH